MNPDLVKLAKMREFELIVPSLLDIHLHGFRYASSKSLLHP